MSLAKISVIRNKSGIRLHIVSEELEKLFHEVSRGKSYVADDLHWKGKRFYRTPEDLKFKGLGTINSSHGLIMYNGSHPNLGYFRRVGIGEGKFVTIPGLFLEDEIEKYLNLVKLRLQELHTELISYLKNKETPELPEPILEKQHALEQHETHS